MTSVATDYPDQVLDMSPHRMSTLRAACNESASAAFPSLVLAAQPYRASDIALTSYHDEELTVDAVADAIDTITDMSTDPITPLLSNSLGMGAHSWTMRADAMRPGARRDGGKEHAGDR